MTEFNTAIDIGNRACDHIGVGLLSPTLGFSDPSSKQAARIGAVYGKLRRAELRRNVWRFATRRTVIRPVDTTTMLIAASLWVASTTYFVGSIVADAQGNLWISRAPNNLGNQPLTTSVWEPYFGPLTVSLYTSTTSYFAGELVYTAGAAGTAAGTNRVYLSLQSANQDNPATATAWAATATYSKNQVVSYLAVPYMSLIDLNTNNLPSAATALWAAAVSYSIGQSVGASNGVIYTSVTNANIGNDPTLDAGTNWTNTGVLNTWTSVFVAGSGSIKWLQVGGAEFPSGVTLTTPNIIYPIGAGPSSQSSTRNVYRLPSGFLRKAPQDPKAGSTSYLGAPSGRAYDDWNFEGNYLVSADTGPIALRFVADVTDVTMMDDMFCEGLGARIGLEVCEPVTQSGSKLANIAQAYQKFMSEARTVNAIETGSEEPPEDDYIACRA